MPETMVRCQQLVKAYGRYPAVHQVSFTVPTGQVLALLGPSGCGKTTTLRLIAGFEQLDSGWIEIAGRVVADEHTFVPPEKRRAGMVFQEYAIFPHLSVADNIAFGLKGGQNRNTVLPEMLALVGLEGLGDKMPHELSGGQQQRVALARALAVEPAVLLFDEPFSNLDTGLRGQVRAEVRTLLKASGATAIFVTHDQEEALFVGDLVAVMNAGQIEQLGPPEAVYHQPETRFVAEFIGRSDFLPGRVTENGIHTDLGHILQPVDAPLESVVAILLRPDDVVLEPAGAGPANGHVLSRQFMGIDHLYQVCLPDGTILHSRQPHTLHLSESEPVQVGLTTDHPFPCFLGRKAV